MVGVERKPYRLCAFYDSETTNLATQQDIKAFPILHQIGTYHGDRLSDIEPGNVEDLVRIDLYRNTIDACAALDAIPETFPGVVPVVAIHNLSFDMWPLMGWLLSHDVKVLAKSAAKPISFTILDEDGKPSMVLWDTLGFSMQGLAKMGAACGMPKLVGSWDYDLIRTPETPLTDDELAYARHDIYTLACWLGWWCRRNPDIEEGKLGLNVVTKTGIVREKRARLFDGLKGKGCSYNVGRFWHYLNREQLPKTDDELFTMHASTRGGFTFTASRWASRPFNLDDGECIAGFDATSQHPAQMLSRYYPLDFKECSPDRLDRLARIVSRKTVANILDNWAFPFPTAFNACFEFENIRLKPASMFEKEGIATLAYARFSNRYVSPDEFEDNESGENFKAHMHAIGYHDTCNDPVHAFGKLESASVAILFLTEIEYWICCQVYEWDGCKALFGYSTDHFSRPSDMCMLSVMEFYKAKSLFKAHMEKYLNRERLDDLSNVSDYVPGSTLDAMRTGTASDSDVKATYQQLKANLNSLYGIECTNEARQDCALTSKGIAYTGAPGIGNLPKNPKAWYQFGQRVVAWSRVAQIVAMSLVHPHVKGIVNGDTDSLKVYVSRSELPAIKKRLAKMGECIDKAQREITYRVKKQYPQRYTFIPGLGSYELEFETTRYCAAWNKAYTIQRFDSKAGKLRFDFTFAGITTDASPHSYNEMGDWLYEHGWSFEAVCDTLLGYNVTVDATLTKQNARKQPEVGEIVNDRITDYLGKTAHVVEPASLALYPMRKMVGCTENAQNAANCRIAKENRPMVNDDYLMLEWPDSTPYIHKLA